ncbi:MAG: Gfo/Idh/MocA family oxidoreductase [Candidatus Latescibacterota bacterium]|nr:Gfo/Idh/MocA family oxidoreductase [Candidatus Latescibacterota bacterium]
MHRTYRVAVIGGCGTWGRYYLHSNAAHPRCEIIGLVDRARDRRQAFAERYGIEHQYDEVDELLEEAVPDIASAIVPVGVNHSVVTTLAQAGVKALSCEKPIAPSLAEADAMVDVCRELGIPFGCGTAYWEVPHELDTVRWIRECNIGPLIGAAIPGGLPVEVSGGGCVQLTMLRLLTDMEVEWVEGYSFPSVDNYNHPDAACDAEADSPAYGHLGLSGGIVCDIPAPTKRRVACRVSVQGEGGSVYLTPPRSVHIVGRGAAATPVFPDFRNGKSPGFDRHYFRSAIDQLINAIEGSDQRLCSGFDYRQALEIAIALKLSATRGHERIHLPLEDRSLRILPHPYRLDGGDVAGWQSIGYSGPPEVVKG